MTVCDITNKHCKPCEGGIPACTREEVLAHLAQLPGWEADRDFTEIKKTFSFKNYYQTMAFVNAIAFMAHREDHHPDLQVSYQQCVVRYQTHAIAGLSLNDFICAGKVEGLVMQ